MPKKLKHCVVSMNSPTANILKIQDPKYYLENFCKIKTKSAGLDAFILNEAQKDLFNTIRHNKRVICLKSRQIGFCCHPDQRVLTADMRWKKLDEIRVGDELVGVDEFPGVGEERGCGRKMRRSKVEARWEVFEEALKFKMDNGEELIVTKPHRLLGRKWSTGTETLWKKAIDFKIGEEIRFIVHPWGAPDYEDGWFGGMMDGEGCLSKSSRTSVQITISQVAGPVLERLRRYVRSKGLSTREELDKRIPGDGSKLGSKEVHKIALGRMEDVFLALGLCRPARFIDRPPFWDGRKLPGKGNSWPKIVSIEALPVQRMIDLQTSTKTFVLEGFVSHNSTAVTGYAYHYAITHPGVTVALVGYNTDLTKELLDKVKTFYRTTPDALKPTIQYNSKFEITFPRLESKIIILPSTEYVGRGYTINFALLTELAFWDNAEEKMSVLEASIPVDGTIVIESTPNFVGNHFHRMWMADNGYAKKEYGWWWHYSQEDIDLIAKRLNNPPKFAREYCLEFMTSGRSVFDIQTIRAQRKNILNEGDLNSDKQKVRMEEGWRVYKDPESSGMYVFGADIAEGVEGGDYSTATMYNRKTGEEVAFYRGLLSPDRFAVLLNTWGRKYNNALAVVEVNNHGLTTLTVMKQLCYPALYFRPSRLEEHGMSFSDKLGWRTTKVTRPLMIDDFAQALRDGLLIIHSKETLDELLTFVYDANNNMIAQEGMHDDAIFSSSLGFQGFKVMVSEQPKQLDYRKFLPRSFNY